MVVRPSGTEPKLKVYLSVSADSLEKATELEGEIVNELEQLLC
jgi:phosphoglucomutase